MSINRGVYFLSNNLKLAKYFLQKYIDSDSKQLEIFVSSDFKYYVNLGEPLNFKQFLERMSLFQTSSEAVFSDISSEDDVHFYFNFELVLAPPNQDQKAIGLVQVVILGDFISKVFVDYSQNAEEYE